ncbi:hypothetical protein [Candidatus Nitrosotenuis cloacae]|uniref:hypothetical protein n=1 Tax=Candidatus Nitrosotenuis cloacae TaxID=1603555 RepID=UPI0022801D9D|nr:hypothetical protein [Candidatus Nitrosotenuis cloacae]
MNSTIVLLLSGIVLLPLVLPVFGHGVGSETLPPQMLGDRKVAMEVSSIVDNATNRKDVTFSMFDTNTGVTVRDVLYHVKTIRGDRVLFEGDYKTSNGILVMSLIPDKTDKITVTEKKDFDVFSALVGQQGKIEARGAVFEKGGLYRFTIDIVSAEGYSGKSGAPVRFESGLSFAESARYVVSDATYGKHEIQIVTYYDTLYDIRYDAAKRAISFAMPFEWTQGNINQTSTIHEEIFIPKEFTGLQASEYVVTVNGIEIPKTSLVVDDYVRDHRVVHILLYQKDLLEMQKLQSSHSMEFVFAPRSKDILLAGITENVQYRIEVTAPKPLLRGSEALLLFKIYDVFLQGKTVSVDYALSIKSDETTIYGADGTSTESRDVWNEIRFLLPADSDKIVLHFENLGGNGFARAEIPLAMPSGNSPVIPLWIKNNAGWWCEKSITDDDFLKGIEYLVAQGVIRVDAQKEASQGGIPDWIRGNACWWAEGSIGDADFVNGIAYLIKSGVIRA